MNNIRLEVVPELRFPEFENEGDFLNIAFETLCNSISSGKDKNNSKGLYELYGSTGIIGKSVKNTHKGEYILIARVGANAGKLNKVSGNFGVTDNTLVINLKDNKNITYLFYWLNKYNLNNLVFGSGQPLITGKQLKKLNIVIPKNPKEQQKIANCLSSLDSLITAETEKIGHLKDHKKGLLQQLFPAIGETKPQYRFPEFENDGDWVETTLDDVADYENGKAHEKEISETGKYKVVNSKFISTEGKVVKYTNSANLKANVGDVLMVLSDIPNGKAIAKCFYVDKEETYTVNQRICKITPTGIDNKFLFYIQNRNKYFLAFDDGVKQTNLRKDTVLSFPFLKPQDPKEQQKIANCLSISDDLIEEQTSKIAALKDHKKGLMQQLFPNVNS